MRRVFRTTTAPIFSSFNRIVFGLALASDVFSNALRRSPSNRV